MDIKKQLGSKIKRLRTLKGYTQEELAKKNQIATRTLCGIENGENFVKAVTLEKFCDVFNVSLFELLAVDYIKPDGELVDEIISDIKSIKNKEHLEIIYKFVKSLKLV